jgi:hypothetical protein
LSQDLASLGGVVLGWALGFASALVVEWVRAARKASAAKRAVLVELDELAYRLLAVVFRVESRAGRLDKDLLAWMQMAMKRYAGPNRIESLPEGMAQLEKVTDGELATVNTMLSSLAKATFFPGEEAPYSSSAVAQAHEFKPGFALGVIDVLSHLRMYNETRQNGLQYTFMTFQSGLDEANHARIVENAAAADDSLSRRARIIVDKIGALQDEWS